MAEKADEHHEVKTSKQGIKKSSWSFIIKERVKSSKKKTPETKENKGHANIE